MNCQPPWKGGEEGAAGAEAAATIARPPMRLQVDPYRLKGLEVYSTVLWHCKREVGQGGVLPGGVEAGGRACSWAHASPPSCGHVDQACPPAPPMRRRAQVELAQLAQVASSLDRHSPYAWCVLGNCFSLQKVRRGSSGGGCW